MKKLLAALLLLAASYAGAQTLTPIYLTLQPFSAGTPVEGGGSGAPEDAEYFLCAADAALTNAHVAGTDMCTFLKVPSSANLAGTLTNETGTGVAVFGSNPTFTLFTVGNGATTGGCFDMLEDTDNGSNKATICIAPSLGGDRALSIVDPGGADTFTFNAATQTLSSKTLTVPNIGNGSTAGGSYRLLEDTDNGSNYLAIKAPDSMSADRTITVAQPVGDINNAEIATGGPNYVFLYDEFACGATTAGSNNIGSCTGIAFQNSNCTIGAAGLASTADTERIGLANVQCDNATDTAVLASNQTGTMRLLDRSRIRFGIWMDPIASAGQEYGFAGGFHDASTTTGSGAPGFSAVDGAWVYTDQQDDASVPNWMIATNNNTTPTTASCGVAVAAQTWYDWDIWYESGVGVHFILNGTECANSPINTTLPTAREFMAYNFKFEKTLGATNITFKLDYFKTTIPVTRP